MAEPCWTAARRAGAHHQEDAGVRGGALCARFCRQGFAYSSAEHLGAAPDPSMGDRGVGGCRRPALARIRLVAGVGNCDGRRDGNDGGVVSGARVAPVTAQRLGHR